MAQEMRIVVTVSEEFCVGILCCGRNGDDSEWDATAGELREIVGFVLCAAILGGGRVEERFHIAEGPVFPAWRGVFVEVAGDFGDLVEVGEGCEVAMDCGGCQRGRRCGGVGGGLRRHIARV